MAERSGANLVLALIDKITAPARRMAQSMRGLQAAEKAVEAANRMASASLASVGAAAALSARQVDRLASAERRLVPFLQRMGAVHGPALPAALAAMRGSGAVQGPVSHGRQAAFLQRMGAFHGPVFDPQRAGQGPEAGPMFGPRRATAMERLRSRVVGASKEFWKWNEATTKQNDALDTMFGKLAAGPLGMVGRGLKSIAGAAFDLGSALLSAATSAAALTLALGAAAAGAFVTKVVELADFAQRAKSSLGKLAGSTAAGAREFAQARRIARELGQDVEKVTHQFIGLRAAQFSVTDSENIVKLSADLATLGEGAEAVDRVIRAITQIKAKGRLQAEELMQIAEGGNLAQSRVYEQLEKMLGMNREQVLKAQKDGAIDAATAITAIQRAIMAKFHQQRPGDTARDFADKSLAGVWTRLKAMPNVFMLDIAEAVNVERLLAGMRAITKAFETAGRAKLTAFAQKAIDLMGELLPLTIDFAEGFMSGFDGILSAIGDLKAAGLKGYARTAGEWLAKFFAKAIELGKEAIPVLMKAIDDFVKSVDWDALTASLKSIDWGKLAADFVTLAGALAKIAAHLTTATAGTVGAVSHVGRDVADAQKSGGDLWGSIKGNVALYGGGAALGGAALGSVVPGLGTLTGGLAGGVGGAILGTGFGLWDWLLDEGIHATAPEASAGGPQASLRPNVVSGNTFAPVITIQAPPGADEAALARIAREQFEKSMRGLVNNDLSEAVPA